MVIFFFCSMDEARKGRKDREKRMTTKLHGRSCHYLFVSFCRLTTTGSGSQSRLTEGMVLQLQLQAQDD